VAACGAAQHARERNPCAFSIAGCHKMLNVERTTLFQKLAGFGDIQYAE
jgi:hypothetical protein